MSRRDRSLAGDGPAVSWRVRALGSFAVLAVAGTYAAAQLDFWRRHRPGRAPAQYWTPQILQIWLPGLATAALCAAIAFWLHRRGRAK